MMSEWNEQTLFAWAHELGFGKAALCRADAFEEVRLAVERQPWIRERNQLRYDPCADHPRTESLAVLLWPYAPAPLPKERSVFVDSYYDASNAAYHAARELERRALTAGGFVCANASYPAREAAVRAELGIVGKNGLLITPDYGTRVVIILLATDLSVSQPHGDNDDDLMKATCADCGRCAGACPVAAIDSEGLSHPERCLRNFMMEGVVVPEEVRERMEMRLLGCDICQRICPMQRTISCDTKEQLRLDELLTCDEQAFSAGVSRLAERIGRNTARPQRVRAQAALLAGNLRDPVHLPVLEVWAQSQFDAVREHARWAIGRIRETGPLAGNLDRIVEKG